MLGRKDGDSDQSSAPPIPRGFESWVSDFFELSSDRQLTGYGSGPIPNASIARHTQGWIASDAEFFRQCMRAMDKAFLEHVSAEMEKTTDPKAKDRRVVGNMTPEKFDALFG